jgi:hypothetical protein
VLDPTKEQIKVAPSFSLHLSLFLPSPVVRINLHPLVSTKFIVLQHSFKHVFSRLWIGNGPRPSKPYKIYAKLMFLAMSRDSRTGENQTANLFVGLLKGAAQRAITIPDFRYE